MARILHFADLHLDGSSPDESLRSADLSLRRATLQRIVDLALSLNVDALTVGGDLYDHESVTHETDGFIAGQFARLGTTPVLVSPGNHDPYLAGSLYERLTWPANVEIFRDQSWRSIRLSDGLNIWGVGHDQLALQENLLRKLRVSRRESNIALFHGWDTGAAPPRGIPHCPFTIEDVVRSRVDFVLLGHYHKMRVSPEEQPCYAYPGVPVPLEPGDGQGHALLLSHDPAGVTIEPLPLTQPLTSSRARSAPPSDGRRKSGKLTGTLQRP